MILEIKFNEDVFELIDYKSLYKEETINNALGKLTAKIISIDKDIKRGKFIK